VLQEVFKDNDFLQVSSARILVNISGIVKDRDEVKVTKQLYQQTILNGMVYSSATTTPVA
jgi:hypothetical protein